MSSMENVQPSSPRPTPSSAVTVGGGTPTVDFARGKGVWLWDRKGRKFLDCTSQSWALYLGHAHDEIQQHAAEVMRSFWHVHQGFATDSREEFAEKLLHAVPRNEHRDIYAKVAFTATSGLAIETALKLATLNRPGRSLVGRVQGGFHGTTLGTAQLSWPATDDVPGNRRSLSAFAHMGVSSVTLSFPDSNPDIDDVARERAIAVMNLELDAVADKLVAVVVEPLQGSGGQREVPVWWLNALIRRADKEGFTVVFDEIQTYLRTGRHYTQPELLRPHFIVLGKGLCGGFAAGAVLLRSDIDGFPGGGTYDLHTFGSSALAHSVGIKQLEIIDRDDVLNNVKHRGVQLRNASAQMCAQATVFSEIRQVGLHVGLRVCAETWQQRASLAATVRMRCIDAGLVVGLGGYDPSIVKIKPPLNITADETSELISRLTEATAKVPV
ncbi:aminotransferase class III-fold pyridoxal phosphate-dependent enzyme [Williamsia soli]|uniref:aminotransferase class III-fold pyridoxal phosphate-dependent enzyme n=1 Tax=Williamsia soli TaxID=364929 RepID=UPI001A9F64B4|nr:aminotransferase class III-fold pyridoxal phosphate-dependent enzyme [Williamsia soli]